MTPVDDRDQTTDRAPGLAESALNLLIREASRAPIVAFSLGLQVWQRSRPVRDLALRRGNEVLQIVAHTPLGRLLPQPELDDDAEAEAAEIAHTAARATAEAPDAARRTIKEAARETASGATASTGAVASKPSAATKKKDAAGSAGTARAAKTAGAAAGANRAGRAPAEAVAAGAPGVAAAEADRVTARLDVSAPTSRDELPIPDFDNVSIGSLRARLRALSLEQLVTLREWEQAHANRLPVLTLLDNRIAKVAADTPAASAYPADGGPASGRSAAEGAKQAARDEGGTLRI